MLTEAAILWGTGQEWSVEAIELDPPREREVLVQFAASGMCHSDEHLVTGDGGPNVPYPIVGGHEGAGVVLEVGPGVTRVKPGDHVAMGFVPSCGYCPSCARGHSNLCDNGARFARGMQLDGTARHHSREQDLPLFGSLGTFARHGVVNELACIKIPEDVPLDLAALVSCGVTTGWGSAVYAADVKPGDNVAVIGVGGVGAAALQGARLAGADRVFAIDPVAFKREMATTFGADHVYESVEAAFDPIREETWGRMCNKVICTMGVGQGSLVAPIMALVAKYGRCVVTNIHPVGEREVSLNMWDLTVMEKQLVGALFGSASTNYDVPHLLRLYQLGHLDLENMVTNRYKLGDINKGYQDMRDGKNIRGVLVYD
ncbi:NDMA-dependent alcohol dehydrogenase [Pseudonocardia ailaonensis]|uniref:NDMA-dependent alcohol dehydrogenase n=1 Tax=Pseudonocardia ailaonensis TaxID=367279 RepID=A0ABN2NLK0_9PSEU